LLADLGPELRRGIALSPPGPGGPAQRLPSGLPGIDALTGGGLPAARLCEITGPASSGRTSVALAWLAGATRGRGEIAAVVDPADAFDPVSAEEAGVDLERVLWARPAGWREALRATERLLETDGIPSAVLDLGHLGAPSGHGPERRPSPSSGPRRPRHPAPDARASIPPSAWIRLARLAASTRTVLLVLSGHRLTGAQAELVLELRAPHPRFTGSPPLLEGIGLRAVLARQRGGPGHPDPDEEEAPPPARSRRTG
jgi:hypothetical protein